LIEQKAAPLERCSLRPGNVHSADGWRVVLEPVIARYRQRMRCRYFRADAAFANPEVYDLLEAESYKYTIRLPANSVLQERGAYRLDVEAPGGPPAPGGAARRRLLDQILAGAVPRPPRTSSSGKWASLGASEMLEPAVNDHKPGMTSDRALNEEALYNTAVEIVDRRQIAQALSSVFGRDVALWRT
jgi:hypothetical protein